ncbi:MAG: thioredoxin domain-containing protein [Pseudomonadota bacterium]
MSNHPFSLHVPVDTSEHILGDVHAPITVVEYADLECPYCRQAAPIAPMLLERFPGKVRFVFRHYPLEEVHPHSMVAAQAAEAAAAQGKFWPMVDLLFANQSHLTRRNLHDYAERLDLDITRFERELDDSIYLQRVRESIEGGDRSGVRATPSFYINGEIQDVSYGLNRLVERIEQLAQNHR